MTAGELLAWGSKPRLFRRPAGALSPWQVVQWWELRRIPYNLIVGVTGVVTGAVMITTAIICQDRIGVPIGMSDPMIFPMLGAIAFGVMANVCYTAGWVVELILAQLFGRAPARFAEIAFALGLFGSVLLTLVPAVVIVLVAAATLAGWLPVPETVPNF